MNHSKMKLYVKTIFIFAQTCYLSAAANTPNTIPVNNSPSPSILRRAKDAFDRRDYTGAINYYQNALKSHVPQSPSAFPTPVQTITITQKVMSFFKPNPLPTPNPNSKNYLDGYMYLQIGKCYEKIKNPKLAENSYAMGVTAGGDNDAGNICLFEEGFCQMHRKDYIDAYINLKEYVRRNINKDPSALDKTKMKRAVYMASVCAWKLNKSGVQFETDMEGAQGLAKQAFSLLPFLDQKIYFKKK